MPDSSSIPPRSQASARQSSQGHLGYRSERLTGWSGPQDRLSTHDLAAAHNCNCNAHRHGRPAGPYFSITGRDKSEATARLRRLQTAACRSGVPQWDGWREGTSCS